VGARRGEQVSLFACVISGERAAGVGARDSFGAEIVIGIRGVRDGAGCSVGSPARSRSGLVEAGRFEGGSGWLLRTGSAMVASVAPRWRVGFVLGRACDGGVAIALDGAGGTHPPAPSLGEGECDAAVIVRGVKLAMR
jgi:hypothetical protein